MKIVFDENAWEDYLYWQVEDKEILRRINRLIRDIQRGLDEGDPNTGIGKPEALKHNFTDYWSRRITERHRLLYKVVGDELRIALCRHHY